MERECERQRDCVERKTKGVCVEKERVRVKLVRGSVNVKR